MAIQIPSLKTLQLAAGAAVFLALGAQGTAQAADSAGDKTVTQVCATCHGAGLMGAPKIGDTAAWTARLKAAGSLDALSASAVKGKGGMPPKGGMSSLSADDVKAAVSSMLAKSSVTP